MAQSTENFLDMIDSHLNEKGEQGWSGTLRDYIKLVIAKPEIHTSAHARVLRMIESAGVEKDEKGNVVSYKFFENDLFGVEEPIEEIMSYLRAAAAGSEVGRRILLLYGPTSSGKSQLAILLKRGLEKFSRTEEGALYALSESPMHEDPLCAVPEDLREKFHKEYGIKIEGSLSPAMELILRDKYQGNFMNLPVKRIFYSEKGRVGIGTFVPSDKKSQDISELVGSIDLSTIGDFGSESDPRAYRFDGELNVANRGLMEFVEMLKVDQKFLYVLLTLAQEKNIKTGRFPLIWADEFIMAHSIVGDEPVPYRKNGIVKFDTIGNLTKNNDTDIQVIAMNLDTKKLEWTKVKNFYSHPFTGNLIKTIQKNGVVETTYNHSIYSKDLKLAYPEDLEDVFAAREVPTFETINEFSLKTTDNMDVDESGYARIKDVPNYKGNGQYRKNKVKVKYNLDIDSQAVKDILRVFAWYITEGHVNSDHCIISQQNIEDLNLVKISAERISTSVASLQDRHDAEDKTSRLHLSTKIWKELIEESCGKYSTGKLIPDFVFNLPKDYISFFLDELIKGDGSKKIYHNASEEYKDNFFRYKSVSKTLAAQVGFLSTLIGKDYAVNHHYTSTGKDAYEIRYRERDCKPGLNRIEKLFVESLEVFDIACEGNHSFIAGVGQILCHNTNESEYKRFLGKEEMEALHDRTIVVKFPYNMTLDSEIKIYEKLINQANFKGRHIAPHTLRCAAMFSILSRLKQSANVGLTALNKMKMYNGEEVNGFTLAEVSKFKKEFEDEGMIGVSPRYVINRIASTLAEQNLTSITPIDVIRSLRDGMKSNPKIDKKESERLEGILLNVVEEYEKLAKNDVQKAFFVNFEGEIKNLLKNYMDQVEAYLDGSMVENEWGVRSQPDERLMRSIEEKIGITESGKKSFRQEILRKMLKNGCKYEDHPALKQALEKQLFDERQDVIRLTVSARNPDEEELKKINVVVKTLCDKYGYSADSANQLLKYVNSLMARK